MVTSESSSLITLASYEIVLLPDDQPAGWTTRLRTGLVTLVTEHTTDPRLGLELLATLYPDGADSAGLTERDLWARLLLRAGNTAASLDVARKRQIERDSTIPRMLILEALLASGDSDGADAMAAAMVEVAAAGSVAPAQARGLVALASADREAADLAFAEALAKRPDNVPALRGRADCAAAEGDLEGAAGILRDAVAIAGAEARPSLLRGLIELYRTRGDTEAATRAAEELHDALTALAARLREELEATRAAPRAAGRQRAARETAPDAPLPELASSRLLDRARADLDDLPPEELTRALFEHFGHSSFRPGQAAVLRSVLSEGRDTLALMPTGAGKSLCFQLPAVLLPGVVLVISPLVALMADQIAGLAEIPALAGRATYINSTLSPDELEARIQNLAAGAYSLLYLAPERLRHSEMQRALRQAGVSLLVIDEAHCLCLWGHDFRTEYLAVGGLAHTLAVPRILAVTATATPDMQQEIAESLGRPLKVVSTGVLRDNLFLEVRELADKEQKRAALLEFVRAARGSGIVYATSRDDCERLAAELRRGGVNARFYHAGLAAPDRQETQEAFMAGRTRVLVATVAFGMGVNKRDVRFIVHFNPARSLEAYTQEAGRAGRDGQPAHCLLLATNADRATLTRHAREGRLTKDALRALYVRVRAVVRAGGGDPVDLSALTVPDEDPRAADTAARVGLSALERAGYIERGLDVPREIALLLHRPSGDARLAELANALELGAERQRSVRTALLAASLRTSVQEVEDVLAVWQQERFLEYRPQRRGITLRVMEPAPADGSRRLDALLSAYDRALEGRRQAMAAYISTTRCRNAFIARHFGEQGSRTCGRCDVCAPDGRRTSVPARKTKTAGVTSMDPREAMLRLPGALQFKVGRSGLVKILRGANGSAIGPDRCRLHGVLGGMREVEAMQHLDTLVGEGLLSLVDVGDYKAVVLTERGEAALELL